MFWFGFIVGGGVLGSAVWFGREPITKWYKGAEDYAGALKDKAEAILKAAK